MEFFLDYATAQDVKWLSRKDNHIGETRLEKKIRDQEILCARDYGNTILGWLRFGFFWDNLPFMNLLFVESSYRRQGIGTELVKFWENAMQEQGYTLVMTSSLADEQGQFFYRKLGYEDAGCLLLKGEATEILFTKRLG